VTDHLKDSRGSSFQCWKQAETKYQRIVCCASIPDTRVFEEKDVKLPSVQSSAEMGMQVKFQNCTAKKLL